MTDVAVRQLSIEAARNLTEEVKADAAALWAKLLTLYEGKAHIALGYSSWGDYYEEEFGAHRREGYRLLDAARVTDALSDQLDTEPTPSESVARELAPVLKDEGPEAVEKVWVEVVQKNGDSPTAAQVREAVEERKPAPSPGPRAVGQHQKLLGGITERAAHIADLAPHLDLEVITALSEEEKELCKRQLSDARTALSRIIAAL